RAFRGHEDAIRSSVHLDGHVALLEILLASTEANCSAVLAIFVECRLWFGSGLGERGCAASCSRAVHRSACLRIVSSSEAVKIRSTFSVMPDSAEILNRRHSNWAGSASRAAFSPRSGSSYCSGLLSSYRP